MTSPKDARPDPRVQLLVLGLCRICDPIATMSITPYSYAMILSFNITGDKSQVARDASLLLVAFLLPELLANISLGPLSDRAGRRPILLLGMFSTGLSMLVFGFSSNFLMALAVRAVGGLLNGNTGVLNTVVAETVTSEAHQPQAFSVMPFAWSLGTIIGAGIGGALADPVKTHPTMFKPDGFFGRFPYLLPNLVCSAVIAFNLIVGVLYLEESHEDKRNRKDLGLKLGQKIARAFSRIVAYMPVTETKETDLLLPPRDGKALSGDGEIGRDDACAIPSLREKPSWRQALNMQVALMLLGYGILAFHTISLEQLLPILFSMPESEAPPSGIFKFTGGFALSSQAIGFINSFQGCLQMIVQFAIFPLVSRRLGNLMTFRTVVFLYPFYYCLVPYLVLLPRSLRYPGILAVLVFKATAQSLSFPSIQIMIAYSVPSKRVLGTANGLAASSANLGRVLGPIATGIVHSWSLRLGYSGMSWWVCAAIAAIGAGASLWIEGGKRSE